MPQTKPYSSWDSVTRPSSTTSMSAKDLVSHNADHISRHAQGLAKTRTKPPEEGSSKTETDLQFLGPSKVTQWITGSKAACNSLNMYKIIVIPWGNTALKACWFHTIHERPTGLSKPSTIILTSEEKATTTSVVKYNLVFIYSCLLILQMYWIMVMTTSTNQTNVTELPLMQHAVTVFQTFSTSSFFSLFFVCWTSISRQGASQATVASKPHLTQFLL